MIGLVVPDRVVGAELCGRCRARRAAGCRGDPDRPAAEVGTEAPESDAILGIAPPLDGKSSQEDEAPAPSSASSIVSMCALIVASGKSSRVTSKRSMPRAATADTPDSSSAIISSSRVMIQSNRSAIRSPRHAAGSSRGWSGSRAWGRPCLSNRDHSLEEALCAFVGSGHLRWPMLAGAFLVSAAFGWESVP